MDMNKPVAWLFVLDGCRCVTLDEDASHEIQHNGTPLYTHPVKELTKELDALLCSVMGEAYLGEEKEQALAKEIRAILRKAQK